MRRTVRQRLALIMSLILVTFTVCQGMALAALPPGKPPAQAVAMDLPCHQAPSADTGSHKSNCPSDCEHVLKASDPGPQLRALEQPVAFTLAVWPDLCTEASGIQLAALPLHTPVTDPPPVIRFHRFRE